MSSGASASGTLRTQGVHFARLFQGSLRLAGVYSLDQVHSQPVLQNALAALNRLFAEVDALTISFQFNSVVLNTVSVQDAALAWLAGEFARRNIGFISFSRGIDADGMVAVLRILAARPEDIAKAGGLDAYLQQHPLQHARMIGAKILDAAAMTGSEESTLRNAPAWLLSALAQAAAQEDLQKNASELKPEQRSLLPQLREVAACLATGDPSSLSKAAFSEEGSFELVQTLMANALGNAVAEDDFAQVRSIFRDASRLGVPLERLLKNINEGGCREGLARFHSWLVLSETEKIERLIDRPDPLETSWLIEEFQQPAGQALEMGLLDLLLAVFEAAPAGECTGWAPVFERARALLAQACATSMPGIARELLDSLCVRLKNTTSAVAAAPLFGCMAVLAERAANSQDLACATAAAELVANIASTETAIAGEARKTQGSLLKPETLSRLVADWLDKKADPATSQAIQKFLKRTPQAAGADIAVRLTGEPAGPRRHRMLQLIKLLGAPALSAVAPTLKSADAGLVRDVVAAMGEIGDAVILPHLEPALRHDDERVQQAAVLAAQRTRSDERAIALAGSLLHMKRTVLDEVLEDLSLLKSPRSLPFLEEFVIKHPPNVLFQQVEKALFTIGAIGTNASVQSALRCARAKELELPYRQSAIRVLGRMDLAAAQDALKYIARTETDRELAQEATRHISIWDYGRS